MTVIESSFLAAQAEVAEDESAMAVSVSSRSKLRRSFCQGRTWRWPLIVGHALAIKGLPGFGAISLNLWVVSRL